MSVVFSVFDFKKGSIPVYSTIAEDTAKKVALRSQLTLSMMQDQSIEETEAVIPFPEKNQIGYVYLFKIPGKHERGKEHTASLTYLVDSSKRMELYQQAPVLQIQAEKIASQIKNKFTYEMDKPIPRKIQNLIKEWGNLLENATIELEEKYYERKITIRASETEPSIPFLFKNIRKIKMIEGLITSLFLGKPIFLVGNNKTEIELAIASLEVFVPHKVIRKVTYTDTPIDLKNVDIVGISRNLINFYTTEVILDLDKGYVSNGELSTFIETLLKRIKGKDHASAQEIINEQILWLLDCVSRLVEAFGVVTEEEEREKIIQQVIKEAPSALNIIIELAISVNPLIADHLRGEMGRWKEKALYFDKRGW